MESHPRQTRWQGNVPPRRAVVGGGGKRFSFPLQLGVPAKLPTPCADGVGCAAAKFISISHRTGLLPSSDAMGISTRISVRIVHNVTDGITDHHVRSRFPLAVGFQPRIDRYEQISNLLEFNVLLLLSRLDEPGCDERGKCAKQSNPHGHGDDRDTFPSR